MILNAFFFFKLYKKTWLLCGGYSPHRNSINHYLENTGIALDSYLSTYDNIIMLGDLNCESILEPMEAFCIIYNLKHLINEPTCFKNMDNPSCIDLILTNKNRSFTLAQK